MKTSSSILIVVLCAAFGFYLTYFIIKSNIVQYNKLPENLNILVEDNIFSLKVNSKLPIDTVVERNYVGNDRKLCKSIIFHQNPSFLLWIMFICTTVAIASGAAPFFISQAISLKLEFKLSRKEIWVKGILFALIIIMFLLTINFNTTGYYQPPDIINYFKILLADGYLLFKIVIAILILILPGLVVMFLTGTSSDKIYGKAKIGVTDSECDSIKSIEQAAKRIKILNQSLHSALQILATIIVFSSLSASTLGESIKAMVSVEGFDLYPSKTALVYGMFFSLFLCIVYLPTYYYLKSNYNKLKELASELEETKATPEWYTSLFGEIKLEGTAVENIKLALTIVAPLITSFLPNLELLK